MMTAVQAVFSDLEEMHPQLFNVYTTEGKEFINHFHKYLAIEKEQIEDAYDYGFADGFDDVKYDDEPKGAEKYYNETYNPESNESI